MLGTFTLLYLIAGSVTALVTMRVFPPMEGFRPGLSLLLLAFIVFALLWPVLVLLAIWYRLTSFLQSSEPEEANGEQQSAARMPVTSGVHAQKPR